MDERHRRDRPEKVLADETRARPPARRTPRSGRRVAYSLEGEIEEVLPGVTLLTAAGHVDEDFLTGITIDIGGEEFLRWILEAWSDRSDES